MASGIIKFLKKKVCVQTAIYWEYQGTDAYGNKTYTDPVEIRVRWDDQTELVRDDTGKEVASKAQVQVLQDLEVDSWLYLGSLSDFGSPIPNPEDVDGAYKIIRFDKNPLFNSTDEFTRVAYL
jgi:hypothetical protein